MFCIAIFCNVCCQGRAINLSAISICDNSPNLLFNPLLKPPSEKPWSGCSSLSVPVSVSPILFLFLMSRRFMMEFLIQFLARRSAWEGRKSIFELHVLFTLFDSRMHSQLDNVFPSCFPSAHIYNNLFSNVCGVCVFKGKFFFFTEPRWCSMMKNWKMLKCIAQNFIPKGDVAKGDVFFMIN